MAIARNDIPGPVSVTALGCALSTALIVLFVLCLLIALVFPNLPATHAWVGLFSAAPLNSARVWFDGVLFSIVFGWVAAIVFGVVYNRVISRIAQRSS